MKRVLLVLLLLVMTTCTNETAPGHIPFRTSGGVPTIAVEMNGELKRLLIDTGATNSMIDIDVAKDLGAYLKLDDSDVSGIGGSVKQYTVTGLKVYYRDSVVPVRFKAIDFPVGKKIGVVGVLGTEYFKRHKMVIDYSTNTIHK